MKTIRYMSMLAALLLLSSFSAGAQSAQSLLKQTVDKLSKHKAFEAVYTISTAGESSSGSITVQGSMFRITGQGVEAWFDGKTQWTYLPDQDEIDITEPTAAEIQQINPFAVVGNGASAYNVTQLQSDSAAKRFLQLTPKNAANAGGISRIVLTIDTSSLLPEKAVITMSSRSVITITITAVKGVAEASATAFRPSQSLLKTVEVVDLRD